MFPVETWYRWRCVSERGEFPTKHPVPSVMSGEMRVKKQAPFQSLCPLGGNQIGDRRRADEGRRTSPMMISLLDPVSHGAQRDRHQWTCSWLFRLTLHQIVALQLPLRGIYLTVEGARLSIASKPHLSVNIVPGQAERDGEPGQHCRS